MNIKLDALDKYIQQYFTTKTPREFIKLSKEKNENAKINT